MSEISTDKITPRIKSATKITQIDADSKFPAGHIIQIKSTQSSTYLATGNSYVDAFTDLSLTTSGANKILINYNITIINNL